MSTVRSVAVLVGSLRKESFSRKVALSTISMAPPSLKMEIVEIGHLSLYNQDLDEKPPADWRSLRELIRNSDAVLFVTPEYNRSVPGLLKNAVDIASRPYGDNAFDGKPGGVISVSPGGLGAFGANHHLRQALVYLNVPTMPQPEAYVSHAASLFDAQGNMISEPSRRLMQTFAQRFADWIEANVPR